MIFVHLPMIRVWLRLKAHADNLLLIITSCDSLNFLENARFRFKERTQVPRMTFSVDVLLRFGKRAILNSAKNHCSSFYLFLV